jgi:hypothetical protein
MYVSTIGENSPVVGVVEAAAADGLEALMFATWVPANAKNRNMTVPTNSASVATKCSLIPLFIHSV